MKTYRLLALTPPQDSEMAVLSLRSYLFSHYGYASALVLPIMIPICSVRDDIPLQLIIKALKHKKFRRFHMVSSKPVDISGYLFLEIEKGKELPGLIAECTSLINQLAANRDFTEKNEDFNCFPFFNGFFLARNEENTDELEILVNYPGSHAITLNHYFISFITMNIHTSLDKWWENIDWEIPVQIKSKK